MTNGNGKPTTGDAIEVDHSESLMIAPNDMIIMRVFEKEYEGITDLFSRDPT